MLQLAAAQPQLLHCRACLLRRRQDQVKAEISSYLKMMGEVYDAFGLDYKMALSTRPEGYLGELEVWNQAEAALEEALNATGREWEVRLALFQQRNAVCAVGAAGGLPGVGAAGALHGCAT